MPGERERDWLSSQLLPMWGFCDSFLGGQMLWSNPSAHDISARGLTSDRRVACYGYHSSHRLLQRRRGRSPDLKFTLYIFKVLVVIVPLSFCRFNFSFVIYFWCVQCGSPCVPQCTCNLGQLVLPFRCVSSGDWTLVLGPRDKCLYTLNRWIVLQAPDFT